MPLNAHNSRIVNGAEEWDERGGEQPDSFTHLSAFQELLTASIGIGSNNIYYFLIRLY